MEKKLISVLSLICTFVIIGLLFSSKYAQSAENSQQKAEETEQYFCIDAKKSYLESLTVSKNTTNTSKSIDSTVRGELTAKLLMVNSIVYGSDIFCKYGNEEVSTETQSGLLPMVDNQLNALVYNIPSVNLVAHFKDQFTPEKSSVYAQSSQTGYDFLKNEIKLDQLWQISRNIAYILLVLALVFTGFAIMFRSKLSGQVTVTVMNSIPKIIIGAVLVTFSFAISGLILDLGRFVINILGGVFTTIIGGAPLTIQGIGEMFTQAMDASDPNWGVNVGVATGGYVAAKIVENFVAAGGWGEGTAWALAINGIKAIAKPIEIASTIVLIKYALIGIVSIYASVRLFFTIIITYFKLFLDVILGPIYIVIGSFPGNWAMIVSWFKRMISHVLVFIIIFGIINFAWVIALSGALEGNLNFFTSGVSANVIPDWIISIKGIILLAAYFFAAGAPGIAAEIMKVSSSRSVSESLSSAKDSFKKVPLVGGLMK